MNQKPDLIQASQTVTDFYNAHFNAYHAAEPGDEVCRCVSMEPKAVVPQLGFTHNLEKV